ncbi:helix-turn-helix domain-containing protein [Acetobacterium paludosum]|nr:helix-turn-helix transcriptional regulator [Acetobacterium paludosum]
MSVGETLKKYRKKCGFNAKEFAKKMGIPYSTYSNYENDNRKPSFETLAKLCGVFKITVDDFLMESSFNSDTLINEREGLGLDSRAFAEKTGILYERYLQIEECIAEPTEVEKLKIAHVFENEGRSTITRQVLKDLATMVKENTPSTPESKELFNKFNQLTDADKAKALEFIDLLLKVQECNKS